MTHSVYQPHLIREDFVDFILEKFDPLWSWQKVKAQVVTQHAVSADMFEITLQTNNRFTGVWQAGQYVLVTVQIDGIYHQRSYSIVAINAKGEVILGVKAQGKVSNYLCSSKNLYIELSQAQGDFVLQKNQKLGLFIASGSGITAIYAMVKESLARNFQQVSLLYFNRHPVFHVELEKLANEYPQFNYQFINTTEKNTHFSQSLIDDFCPTWQQIPTYLCGSSALMQSVKDLYNQTNNDHRLYSEYFQPAMADGVIEQVVTFRRSQHDFIADKSLLESAEQAGLKPMHGCRMGICNTCTCTKVSGITKNMLTGEIESEDNRTIKLCISQAMSPVVIDL